MTVLFLLAGLPVHMILGPVHIPVSYTHLDVYKRQVLGLPYESYIANRDVVLSGFKIAKEFLLRDQCVFRQRDLPYTTPVSYTHLDVYKRQV